jgi:hypothetical protein
MIDVGHRVMPEGLERNNTDLLTELALIQRQQKPLPHKSAPSAVHPEIRDYESGRSCETVPKSIADHDPMLGLQTVLNRC